MTDATDAARNAVAEKAVELSKKATPEGLKTIAEAVAQVHFGPQGGGYANTYNGNTHYDYHSTLHHDHPRREPGFGPPEPPSGADQ